VSCNIDHRADAAVELKKVAALFPGKTLRKIPIALAQFCLFDVRVQQRPNKIVAWSSVRVRIRPNIPDNRRSRVVDLSHIRRVFFVHLPNFVASLSVSVKFAGNELLLDRA